MENPDPVIALPALREAMKVGDDYPARKLDLNSNLTITVVEQLREARRAAARLRATTILPALESQSVIDVSRVALPDEESDERD